MVLVSDKQFYMNGYLSDNLREVPRFLKKSYDCVIIVSGHGKVRIGKSTMAQQIGYYIAWLLAGGNKKPKKMKVPFDNTNIVFTPEELMKKAETLPRNSVILYDEGRAGLDSIRAMENINKGMMDFFQECGQYGHVIIIVLPNFFKLSEDIAVARSLFLVDVYHDIKYQRGYLHFYNEIQKEYLYVFGKKKLGTYSKYKATNPSFQGRFTKATPGVDVELYNEQKRKALKDRRKVTGQEKELKRSRRLICWLRYKYNAPFKELVKLIGLESKTIEEIAQETRKQDDRVRELLGISDESDRLDDALLLDLPKKAVEVV